MESQDSSHTKTDDWRPKTLENSSAAFIERNILGVPICVLNPKASHLFEYLEHRWSTKDGAELTFRLYRPGESKVGLPTTEHARWLHIMLAMFAANWNEKGYLNFTFAQMLRLANLKNDSSARDTIYESIKRYRKCQAEWDQAWDGRIRSWNYAFIVESDLFDDQGNLKKNPRKAKSADEWQQIRFCEPIVESLRNESTRRLISTSVFKNELPSAAYMIYTYFYGFSDLTPVERSFETLLRVFPWKGRLTRFIEWLDQNLSECQKQGYVEFYDITKKSVIVKSKNIKDLKPVTIEIEKPRDDERRYALGVDKKDNMKPRKVRGSKPKKVMPVDNLTDEGVLEEYYSRKDKRILADETVETVESFLEILSPSSTLSEKTKTRTRKEMLNFLRTRMAEQV
jgi:hypothetical protein